MNGRSRSAGKALLLHGAAALAALVLASVAGAAPPGIPLRIALDAEGPSTRLVITAAHPVAASVSESKGTIEVVFAEPVVVEPERGRGGDGVLDGWSVRGIRTLVITTGPGFRKLETFRLKNPSRLVLDLDGERNASAGGGSVAAKPEFVVVIDPGHGGVEQGAVGPSGIAEKELTLDLARRLQTALLGDPTVAVVLTRDEDRFVDLDERTGIANHNRADLFLSIHLNAARGRRAAGAETYYLSPDATDEDARTVAALENRAYEPVQPYRDASGERIPGLELILWDLAQNQHLARSARLAESVQSELDALAGTRNRGVRQAPFRVLMGATMPAILVEVGFLSNPEEEARLKTDEHKDKIVQAIERAIGQFRRGGLAAGTAEPAEERP